MGVSPSDNQVYKIKLSSGRILGPLDLNRIRLLILNNQITGVEIARQDPEGDWQNIGLFKEIAEILVSQAAGSLKESEQESQLRNSLGIAERSSPLTPTAILPGTGPPQTGQLLPLLPEIPSMTGL